MESGSKEWRIGDAVAWTLTGNEVVALDLQSVTADPLTLVGTAAVVWEELAASGPLRADALIRNVAEAYGVETAVVQDDVLTLLQRLQAQNLAES